MNASTTLRARFHESVVHSRRTRVLAERIAPLLPRGASVLDVGCGDGKIDHLIQRARPDVRISGVDVLVRPSALIPVQEFDGNRLPLEDDAVDAVLFIDVLHHTDDPAALLAEAARVARSCVVVKDHLRRGVLAGPTLRFMDWFGNSQHGVALTYNYWSPRQWRDAFAALGLEVEQTDTRLGLYPAYAAWLFDRGLHVLTKLRVPGAASDDASAT